MPTELTTAQWLNAFGAVAGTVAAVVVFRRGQRWGALLCGMIALECLLSLATSLDDANPRVRFAVRLPFLVAILLSFGRIREEAQRSKAEREAKRDESR